MKTKILVIITLVALTFLAAIFFVKVKPGESARISPKSFDADTIEKTKAVIYLSTTADKDYSNNGISYNVFVQDDHTTKILEMGGLERGGIALGESEILLEDKDSLSVVGEEIKEFETTTPQFTGERAGYLTNQQIFFSIYNSGFRGEDYFSDVRYGDSSGFKEGTIPHYIVSTGLEKDSVPILTQDLDADELNLKELSINDEIMIKDIVRLNLSTTENIQTPAPILADENNYYIILSVLNDETSKSLSIYRVNKKTLHQDVFEFIDYNNVELAAIKPYNTNNSAAIYKSKLYYVDGIGDVYSFDLNELKVLKEFSLKNIAASSTRYNEETYFKDENLYVLRYDEKKKEHYYLETYSLKNGDLVDSFDILGLHELLESSNINGLYSYDLKILK